MCLILKLTSPKARLPQGATLLGVVLSSDKMGLTSMTGDCTAHPLLITLANIDSAVRSSSSSHALKLLALIPVPKFTGVKKGLHGILENHLTHLCLNSISAPLKAAAQNGVWMSDYAGHIYIYIWCSGKHHLCQGLHPTRKIGTPGGNALHTCWVWRVWGSFSASMG